MLVEDRNIKLDIDKKDFEKYEKYKDMYNNDFFENIKVEKDDDTIIVSDKDGLNLEFKSISKDVIKDNEGNIFKGE